MNSTAAISELAAPAQVQAGRVFKGEKFHFPGLDSIRFFCALWVLLGHCGPFPISGASHAGSLSSMVKSAWGVLFCGPAAVIVFFVISGFCIHYPFRGAERLPVLSFLARRYIRIGIPALAAAGLASWVGVEALLLKKFSFAFTLGAMRHVSDHHTGLIWSLVCELIYYTCYPGLFVLYRRVGWKPLILFSCAPALVLLLLQPRAGDYPSFGHIYNWLLGLPCWLLGCQLAEASGEIVNDCPSRLQIWALRLAVWGASSLCMALRFHSPLGYPWTLNLFAVLACWWIFRELQYHRRHAASRLTEWAGKWSYSIYLGHVLAFPVLLALGLPQMWMSPPSPILWALRVPMILVFCWLLYLACEKPSHLLARQLGARLAKVSA